MRLFLSSWRINQNARDLTQLAGDNARTAVVLNALDSIPDLRRGERQEQECHALEALGPCGFELDLRAYFGRQAALRTALERAGLIWVTGGNVFVLRQAMRRSGLDAVLGELVRGGALVYGGYSAGACVAWPDAPGSRTRRRRSSGARADLGRAGAGEILDRPALPLRSP